LISFFIFFISFLFNIIFSRQYGRAYATVLRLSVVCNVIRYDTIGEFNVDSKSAYSDLSNILSRKKYKKKKLKQESKLSLGYPTALPCSRLSSNSNDC